jgi:hypothetical protein
MAVELCRVALWIEALEPGKPLTFLDSHIRCGDSLIGVFDYEALRRGIPDEAYKPLAGDSKETAKAYAKHNKQHREGKGATGFLADLKPPAALIDAARALIDMPEDTLGQIAAKRAAFERLHTGASWLNLKTACDCYIAAYFAPKSGGTAGAAELARPSMPLTDHVWAAARGQAIDARVAEAAEGIARFTNAFHWPLEFPHVFARGGFDVVIGNPPWEQIQLDPEEWFASKAPEIANTPHSSSREKAIEALKITNPQLLTEYNSAKHLMEAYQTFIHSSERFPTSSYGRLNTAPCFVELFFDLAASGRAGIIVPTGIVTDSFNQYLFAKLLDSRRLAGVADFENKEAIFPGVHRSYKFCVLSIGASERASFAFFLTNVAQLGEAERRFTLNADQIVRLNPNTKTAPVFRSRADAEMTAKLYSRAPVLIEERPADRGGNVNPWRITFQLMFMMNTDSVHFRTARELEFDGWIREGADWFRDSEGEIERRIPLYEAKMIHHFDHRWATYTGGVADDEEGARDCTVAEKQNPTFEPQPRYWVPEDEVKLRAARVPASLKRGLREKNAERVLKSLVEWLTGYLISVEGRAVREDDLLGILGRNHAWRTVLGAAPERFLREPKTLANGVEMQDETPLMTDDIPFLTDGPKEPLALATALIDRKQPRWLMGWRDICRSTDERTVIGGIFPVTGVGNNLPIWYPGSALSATEVAALIGILSSLPLDFSARHKVGGTHLNFFIAQQLPVLPPSAFTPDNLAFLTPRVLELTYTSHAMRPWAEDLGYSGPPFAWDESRRAQLRADLDAFFARKYGLTRDELRYVLDPADTKGADYPSETFRGLKAGELKIYGKYRTQRLVLAAFDQLTGV